MAKEKDQEFVEYVVKEIVSNKDAVKVVRSIDEKGVLLELTVDPEDMGVVIGKEGKTAKSIRTLLRVLGAKNDSRVNLKIVEPEGSERPARKEEASEESAAEVTEEVEEAPVGEEASEVVEEETEEEPMADLDI
ncbi:MAG: KH domain-containing protein [bacterium]|nr:KH domain-containing protein [bacterium]